MKDHLLNYQTSISRDCDDCDECDYGRVGCGGRRDFRRINILSFVHFSFTSLESRVYISNRVVGTSNDAGDAGDSILLLMMSVMFFTVDDHEFY